MNAKSIKDTLISYLTAKYNEVRIYQEKSIGSSICDVMAVTNRLIGYEIKSDLDNYARLKEQVKAYTLFFDENYLVVGDKHINSAADRIPENWGIICVRNNEIVVIREAKVNSEVSRRKQLSMLWKLELKNLLIKNGMPIFAQKEKGYISDQIANCVETKELGLQIAGELMRRDYSVYDDATDYTIYSNSNACDDFPVKEIVDILSEENLSEFTLDKWIALYKQATFLRGQKEAVYKQPIKERVPHTISYTDIEVSLGVPWVSPEIINDFVFHILDRNYCTFNGGLYQYVKYEPTTGSWFIKEKKALGLGNVNAEVKYGLRRYNALWIIEATLNLREIKLYDNGNIYNETDTLAAVEKQRLINEEFKRWIWEDEDRRWLVEDAYNKLFSQYEKPVYDGSKLIFSNMNENYDLYPYQKDAVQRIISAKNTLLAFDVGTGKTYIMIASAMKMRAEGISRKNMFVVPNHIVGQWEKIFSELYPQARLLAIEPKTFKPDMRRKTLEQIRDGDYDGIIIAYSCFEMIPMSVDSILDNMNYRLRKIDDAMQQLKNRDGYLEGWASAPLGNEKKYIAKLTQEFVDSMNDSINGDITFDSLEINTLFVDEAHNYKNIPIRTNLRNLNGINTKGSKKCQDLLHKVRHVQQTNGGRGVVFATGTPLCNSISDAYAMQLYLQYDELEKSGLNVFDNWVKTFAKPEQLCEIDVDTSKYRFVRRFARFFNLPELSAMFSQIAIFYTNDSKDSIPKFDGYIDVIIPRYDEITAYMQHLCKRTEDIRSGMIDRKYDNMLKVSTDGRKAALDLTLVGEKQPYNEYSKVYQCVSNVSILYGKYPDSTQLIFCDYSTPKGEDFSVYSQLKERLVEAGIPSEEIAFIHNYQTENRKIELFRKFNAGETKVLIGSTFKLGVGANVQVKLKAIHHLDVPWRPADMVQREGRILRRGNENYDVLIYRYITQGSFDSYSWQILETKQRFISQFLSGSQYQRTAFDLENTVLTYSEVKAIALSEPLMKQLAERENEIRSLRIIISKEAELREEAIKELQRIGEDLPNVRRRYTIALMHQRYLSRKKNEDFLIEYRNLQTVLTKEILIGMDALPHNLKFFEFKIRLPQQIDGKMSYVYLEKDSVQYSVLMSDSAEGNAKRIMNKLKRFGQTTKKIQEDLNRMIARKEELETLVSVEDFTYRKRLSECEAEVESIKSCLEISNKGKI